MTALIRLALEPVGARSFPVQVPRCKAVFCPCFLHFPKLQRMEEKGPKLLEKNQGSAIQRCHPETFYLSTL